MHTMKVRVKKVLKTFESSCKKVYLCNRQSCLNIITASY